MALTIWKQQKARQAGCSLECLDSVQVETAEPTRTITLRSHNFEKPVRLQIQANQIS